MITDLAAAHQRKGTFRLLYLSHDIGFTVGPTIAGFRFNRYLPCMRPLCFLLSLLAAALLIGMQCLENRAGRKRGGSSGREGAP